MVNLINIKRKIGELYNQHLNDENVDEAINFDNNGHYACISFHKAKGFAYIDIEVTTEDIDYKFIYPNKSGEKFDMYKLENVSPCSIKYHD